MSSATSVEGLCTENPSEIFSSRAMIEVVFPSLYRHLKVHAPRLIGIDVCEILWPAWAARQCPELRSKLSFGKETYVVRNPTLLPLQAMGFMVGFVGAILLLNSRKR